MPISPAPTPCRRPRSTLPRASTGPVTPAACRLDRTTGAGLPRCSASTLGAAGVSDDRRCRGTAAERAAETVAGTRDARSRSRAAVVEARETVRAVGSTVRDAVEIRHEAQRIRREARRLREARMRDAEP